VIAYMLLAYCCACVQLCFRARVLACRRLAMQACLLSETPACWFAGFPSSPGACVLACFISTLMPVGVLGCRVLVYRRACVRCSCVLIWRSDCVQACLYVGVLTCSNACVLVILRAVCFHRVLACVRESLCSGVKSFRCACLSACLRQACISAWCMRACMLPF
jgi:hypothetical protein